MQGIKDVISGLKGSAISKMEKSKEKLDLSDLSDTISTKAKGLKADVGKHMPKLGTQDFSSGANSILNQVKGFFDKKEPPTANLFSSNSGVTSATVSASQLRSTKSPDNVAPFKQAFQSMLGKTSEMKSDLQVTGVSAQSVRSSSSDQKATFNPNSTQQVTTNRFGEGETPDSDVVVNFSDQSFGGVMRHQASFALEEIVTHSSRQLLALQDGALIPQQRTGGAKAGEGQSHAQALSGVEFQVTLDTNKSVTGPNNENLGSMWGNGANRVYDTFVKAAQEKGEKFGPEEFAKILLDQGVVKKNDPPSTKTVLSQVAPTLSAKAGKIQELKVAQGEAKKFTDQGKPVPDTLTQRITTLQANTPTHANGNEVEDYFYSVDAGMEALVQAKTGEGKQSSEIYYPGGWFGAGAFSNPGSLLLLLR
jgi:hypothetical protein